MLNVLTERINSENITRYMHLLSNAEIFGISDERLCAFGASDERTDNTLGVLVTEIFPQYIRIEKLYTVSEYRNNGVAEKLLSIIIEPIVTKKMPIFIYTTDSIDVSYIQSKGFKKTDDDYCYIEGRLGNLKDISLPSKKDSIVFDTIDKVSVKDLDRFVFRNPHDNLIQFPEGLVDINRFSDGSLVCKKDGKIEAVILTEEQDDRIDVTYIYSTDAKYILNLLSILKKLYMEEYTPQTMIRFLICNNKVREGIEKILAESKERPLNVYRLT
ncbi:MAG: GNAT family N-acetyltransferase [Lachnospiraceae bacterium]|nr:GNAT family N-acetyltransferase [Lachnospiraceae bacterium]MBP5414635.1 GNAT family N-acetyltransferase [Lachnospiraceae bacterium]MBP5744997.1 GNAT family N-acetyltransferase [Lachnospiraceae bacterium]